MLISCRALAWMNEAESPAALCEELGTGQALPHQHQLSASEAALQVSQVNASELQLCAGLQGADEMCGTTFLISRLLMRACCSRSAACVAREGVGSSTFTELQASSAAAPRGAPAIALHLCGRLRDRGNCHSICSCNFAGVLRAAR